MHGVKRNENHTACHTSQLRDVVATRVGAQRAVDTHILVTRWPALLLTPSQDVADVLDRLFALLKLSPKRTLDLLLQWVP